MKKRLLILALTLSAPMYSQIFSFGVKGGIPATSTFQNSTAGSYERRYIIGPTAEIHLPFHFAFEVDALYRRAGYEVTFTTYQFGGPPRPPVEGVQGTKLNDWQIPFLAKWAPGARIIRPFVDAGVAYRHVSGQTTILFPFLSQSSPAIISPNVVGATVGAGFATKLAVIRISPEIRYTHWASPPSAGLYFPLLLNANQVDFLLGLTF